MVKDGLPSCLARIRPTRSASCSVMVMLRKLGDARLTLAASFLFVRMAVPFAAPPDWFFLWASIIRDQPGKGESQVRSVSSIADFRLS